MSVNNTMYLMFRQMIQGYKLGSEGTGLFEHGVHCWLSLDPENPFQEGTEAFEHFFRMKNYYNVWKLHSADQRISQKRMLNAARDLCETRPKNPYHFDKKAAEEEKASLKENALKEEEEKQRIQIEKDRLENERNEELKQILEEVRQDDLDNQNHLEATKIAREEAEAEVRKNKPNIEKEKAYVFGVVPQEAENKKERKGWLHRLLKR